MLFYDLTITGIGERRSTRQHDTGKIAVEAIEFFDRMLAAQPRGFDRPLPHDAFAHINLKWTSEDGVNALATFAAADRPLTTSALLTGGDPIEERRILTMIQRDLVGPLIRAADPSGRIEAGFDLLGVKERPVLVTVVLPGPIHPDLPLVADMETCLAAAFFLRSVK